MLKKIRVIVSLIIFCLLFFYFLDFADILSDEFHRLGHIQFIPALLSLNVVVIASLIVCALVFGRIYCSSICPVGVFQDIVNRCSKFINPKKKFIYRKNNPILRWSIVALCLIFFFLNLTVLVGIFDPYSAFGRIVVHIFKPVYLFANNILADIFTNFGNYTFYRMSIEMLSVFSFIVAAVTFVTVGILAFLNGRIFCNTICPVGTIFGFINKFSFFKIRINSDKCVSCGVCEQKCKSRCINIKTKIIDYSRCVNCFSCLNNCNQNGISFTVSGTANKIANRSEQKNNLQEKFLQNNFLQDNKKRQFILTGLAGAIAVPTVLAQEKIKSLIDEKENSKEYFRHIAISPPGSISAERLQKHCTACHLCVSKCPSKVLKPAFLEYGFAGIMQPMMQFEKGYCNYNCTVCSSVCPSHALLPLTLEEKRLLQVGKVVFIPEICVVYTDGTNCGACSEHCPTQAVKMIPYKGGLTLPYIDVDICIGCGGCEYICPVKPHRAIYVEGNKIHQQAKPFIIEEIEKREITDFGF